LIADSVKNWQEYLASLETQLTDQVWRTQDNRIRKRLTK
jgi:hypothetical protein